MSFDVTSFEPDTVDDLTKGLVTAISSAASAWFETQRDLTTGYLRAIANAAIETQTALARGNISQSKAHRLMMIHRRTLRTYLSTLEYETFELRQGILDAALQALGYAILNKTGINVAPALLKKA